LIAKRNPVLEAYFAKCREEARAACFPGGFAHSGAEAYALDRARGKAEAVVTVLAARKIAVGDAERVRILGESDLVQLDRWLFVAVTTTSGPG
jgi:hypothetical protein